MPTHHVLYLQRQIEREYHHARRRFVGRFVSTRHELWSQAFKNVDRYREQLIQMVGKQQASAVMCEISLGGRTRRTWRGNSPFLVSLSLGWLWSYCRRCLCQTKQRVEGANVSVAWNEIEAREHIWNQGAVALLSRKEALQEIEQRLGSSEETAWVVEWTWDLWETIDELSRRFPPELVQAIVLARTPSHEEEVHCYATTQ